jgi:HK97 gp10 family phage protein
MADSVKLRMEGDLELTVLLAELPRRVASKGNRAAATAGAKPVRSAVKAGAPRESGLLKKAIGSKIKTYKGGTATTAVAVIGARRDIQGTYKGRRRVPANYIHLVNKGTKHSPANDFVGRGYSASKDQAVKVMADRFKEVVETEAAKLGKR